MRNTFIFIFCLFSSWAMASPLPVNDFMHEFHMSRCMIDYKAHKKTIEITLNIFIDDLELALDEQGATDLFIGTEREHEEADTYINRYLNQTLQLAINNKSVEFNYLGKELSDDLEAVWCYLEIMDVKRIREIAVQYDLFMEVFDDQKNIINITSPEQEDAYFLFRKGYIKDSVRY